MLLLATLLAPSRGEATIFGHDVVRERGAVRRRLGLVFQETSVDGLLTVEENLRFAGRLAGLGGRELRAAVAAAIERAGLGALAAQPARQLSGGWRRLVDIARATLHRPDLLILDEPTVGLDPEHRELIWTILGAERRERGTTVLFSTHYLAEAEPADRVVLLSRGRAVADGTPAALRAAVGAEVAEIEGPGAERLARAIRGLGATATVLADRPRFPGGHHRGAGGGHGAGHERPRDRAARPSAGDARGCVLRAHTRGRGVSAWSAVVGIVARDLARTTRQTSRLLGGLARPFMWLLLVGSGYNAIARLEGGLPYQAFVFPGIVVMAALFGAMLTAIGTVYDREFGMLRLMLASPAGVPAVLTGRAIAAALVGVLQGGIVLAVRAAGAAGVAGERRRRGPARWCSRPAVSAMLGLLVAARLRSVENFAGVINVVLFPLLFVSGALYPTAGMPPALRLLARVNPVTYQVDLMRHAFGQPAEFAAGTDVLVLAGVAVVAFGLTALLFDPEQRFVRSEAGRRASVILSGAKDRAGGAS